MSVEQELGWLRDSVGLYDCSESAVLAVKGDDAQEWLQGQVTNDLKTLRPDEALYAFVLSPKGRVLADTWVLDRGQELLLLVPRGQLDALLARFDRYIIMEDVELEQRDDWGIVTAQGPAAEQLEGGYKADCLGRGGRHFLLSGQDRDEQRAALEARCAELGGGRVGPEAWARAHVLQGRPRFGVDFGENSYPQETGLAKLAVSLTKGCYLGQETVMMLQSRGKAPKILWRWSVETQTPPSPQSPITFDGLDVGQITSAVKDRSGVTALGYLKRGHEATSETQIAIADCPARALGSVEDGLQ